MKLPHLFSPRDYQMPFLRAIDSGKKRAVICWHRRSGKDKVCFNYMIKKAFERVGTYYYFLPNRPQGKKVIWDNIDNDGFKMLDHVPINIIEKTNETELKIEFINGSILQVVPADIFSTSGVGSNPIGVVFSEFSVTDKKAWDFLRPILLANGGWVIFNFTPRGTNHAHKVLEIGRQNPNEWFTQILTVNETGIITPEQIEGERREGMPEDMIQQEYYCKFIDGATNFFKRVDENTYDPSDPNYKKARLEGASYQIGVDLAKFNDFSVVTPFSLATFHVLPQERFNQIDYNLQKAKIENSYLRHAPSKIVIDSTGVGEPVYDDLVSRGMSISPFRFTEKSRMDLLRNLQMLLEQDKIKIPNDPTLIAELKSAQYQITEGGRLTVQVPDGLHDDCIMSLALSVWQIPAYPLRPNLFRNSYQTEGVEPMDPSIGF